MQNKTTVRYYLTPVRTAITNKNTNSTCWQGYGEKGTSCCWYEYKLLQPLWKTEWRCLKIIIFLMTYLPCDSAIPLLSIYLKKAKMLIQKDMYTLVHSL